MRQAMSFLAGALCGALVGTAAALLLAPASGLELRGQTQTRFHELWDSARQAAATRRTQLEEQLAALKAPHPPAPSA